MNRRQLSRRGFLRLVGSGITTAAVGGLLAACGGDAAAPTATADTPGTAASPTADAGASPAASGPARTLVIGKAQEAVGFDPALVTAASSFELIAVTYNQLVAFDENYAAQPELAEAWESLDDRTFVFRLREGVTFHNGRAVTAADVKYSLERIIDPATASPWASQLEPIEAIETSDDRTVEIQLKEPYGPLLATLSSDWAAIVPKEAVEEHADLQSTIDGTGPFKLKEHVPDTKTVMVANPDYWEPGLPKLSELTYQILPDEASRLAAIRTGEIGLTGLANPASVELAQQSEGVKVASLETTDYYLLGINTARPPFDNIKVRQALSLVIDRQAILQQVFFGEGSVTGPIVPTLGDWGAPLDELPYYAPDHERARQLLAEAGLGDGFDMTILASPQYQEFINIALMMLDQLKQVGINATLDQVEWGTFIDRWRNRDFDTFVSYNGSGNDPDRALYPAFHTGGSVNAFQFGDPQIDELLEQGRTTVDPQERRGIYREVEQLIAEAAPALFLCTRMAYYTHRDNVTGFEPTPAQTWGSLKQTSVG